MSKHKKAKPNPKPERRGEKKPGVRVGDLPIKEHILMVNDMARSRAYYDAMKLKIRPGDVVLEIGTGAGLLSCVAVRLGARHVYTVEQSPVLHRVAEKVFAANGVEDKVTLIKGHSRDVRSLGVVQEPVDVFVTETIGTQGLDEGIAPIFDHVKDMLSPTARVIPESVRFKHCLVNLSGIREQLQIMQPVWGVNLQALNAELRSNNFRWMQPIESWREVSTTARTPEIAMLDFRHERSTHQLEIIRENVCDGMLCWAEFRLGEDIYLETRNRDFGANWANSVYMMGRTTVARGNSCSSEFWIHDDNVSWTINWRINRRPSTSPPPASQPASVPPSDKKPRSG